MENTARLFIIVIGFCFLIAFVVWIFVAFSKTRVVLENTEICVWYGKMIEVSYVENIVYEQYTRMCVLVRKDHRILLR